MHSAWLAIAGRCRQRPGLSGAVALFLLLSVVYAFSIDIRASRGASITGDEPFYLMTTRSLLDDGNLDLRAQYVDRSYEAFFDHPDGLWTQSVPLEDGRLLSPHNVGLSVLLMPGLQFGGLVGTQLQLLLIAAATWVLSYLLLLQLTPVRPLLGWLVTAGVGLSASAFIYSTEIYPELPAALVLVGALLWTTRERPLDVPSALGVAVLLSTLPWLGAKYVPLAAVVGLYALWHAEPRARLLLVGASALSGLAYVWFHLATFESLTPYHVNLVYAGGSTPQIVEQHVELGDRVYRLWGLLIDRRFGVGRWAPLLLVAVPGLVLLARGDRRLRLVGALVVIQVLIATFVAITMMGWWFPGRTLMTIFPLLPIPIALLASRLNTLGRGLLAALGGYSLAVTVALAEAGRSREVVIAVDPFEMQAVVFRTLSGLFPQYTSWGGETWALTALWLGGAGLAAAGWLWSRRRVTPRGAAVTRG